VGPGTVLETALETFSQNHAFGVLTQAWGGVESTQSREGNGIRDGIRNIF
jgi:hypothetical protein